jgi:hypothetical protein
MENPTIEIGGLQLRRLLFVDVLVPPDIMGLSPADIGAVSWRIPTWGEGDEVRVSASAWVVDGAGRRIVMDPMFAADDLLHAPGAEAAHRDAIVAQFAQAGLHVDSVDIVLASHIEGIGMIAARDDEGNWQPLFPNARVLVSVDALEDFRNDYPDGPAKDAWLQLLTLKLVDTFADGDEIVPGLRAEVSKAHNPGHTVFHFGAGPDATFVGHLAVSPLHLATGLCPQQHPEPERAWELLHGYADDGRLLLGPLWPSPGFGRWSASDATFA